MRFKNAQKIIQSKTPSSQMTLKEVLKIIQSNRPFDALQKLNTDLFMYPNNINGCADAYIDGHLYCFKFTPNQIFINKRNVFKNEKSITESLHIRKIGGYSCSEHNQAQKTSKALMTSRRDGFNRIKRDIERTIYIRDIVMSKESYSDITTQERSFFIHSLVTYRSVLENEFQFVFPLEVLVSNLINNKDELAIFFKIVIEEKMIGINNFFKSKRYPITHL